MIWFKIVTPHGRYLEENVKKIHATSVAGQFTLLPNHMPVVMAMVPCKLTVEEEDGTMQDFAISGGFLHFDDNKAALLTDAIEGKAEIDIPRAQAAYRRARARMQKIDDEDQMKRTSLALARAINRLHVSGTDID